MTAIDGLGYRAECSCGWASDWHDRPDGRRRRPGSSTPRGAVGPPDGLDRLMSELLDLQDDLAAGGDVAGRELVGRPARRPAGTPTAATATTTARASSVLGLLRRRRRAGPRSRTWWAVPADRSRAQRRHGTRYRRAVRRFGRVAHRGLHHASAPCHGADAVTAAPFYDDGQVTLYCADVRTVDLPAAHGGGGGDLAALQRRPRLRQRPATRLAWPDYWALADRTPRR